MGFYIQGNRPIYVSGPITQPVPTVRMKIERSQEAMQVATAGPESPSGGVAQKASFESMLQMQTSKENLRRDERWVEYTVKENDTLWNLAVNKYHVNLEDIVKDNAIQDPRKIQPGQKIRVRLPSYPEKMDVVASWYGKEYHGKPMANGKTYNMNAATIAHRDLPLGTRVELENPETRQRVNAVVADRGPFVEGRDVDLSYGLAKKLSILEKGVGSLVMRVLG